MEFTPNALALATALVGVKMARDNCIKVGNILSNPKGSLKGRWIFKQHGMVGFHLRFTIKMV